MRFRNPIRLAALLAVAGTLAPIVLTAAEDQRHRPSPHQRVGGEELMHPVRPADGLKDRVTSIEPKARLAGSGSCTSSAGCSDVDVVFVMDTSGSMFDEAAALCGNIQQVVTDLGDYGLSVNAEFLGITNTGSGQFPCLTSTVVAEYGDAVPGSGACGPLTHLESWAPATAILASRYPWRESATRLVVPLSDEGPCSGNPCENPGADATAIANAIDLAVQNRVVVSPITGTGSDACVTGLALQVADATGGVSFQSTDPDADLAAAVIDIILAAGCQSLTTTVLSVGESDSYLAPMEPAFPGPELLPTLDQCLDGGTVFDDNTVNRCFGHTFYDLPSNIVGGTLEIRIRAVTAPDAELQCNDAVFLQVVSSDPPVFLWQNQIGTGGPFASCQNDAGIIPEPWLSEKDYTIVLNLANLPNPDGSTFNLLPDLEARGRLDVRIADDTTVDYLRLDLRHEIDCDDDGIIDTCETAPVSVGFVNGKFALLSEGWRVRQFGDSSVTFNGSDVSVTGRNDGITGIAGVGQGLVELASGTFEFDLKSYSSSDVGPADFPVVLVDGVAYGLNADGTLSAPDTAGTIDNESPVDIPIHFAVDVVSLAGPGPYTIELGVRTTNSSGGAGTAVFDNVLPVNSELIINDCNLNLLLDVCEIGNTFSGFENVSFDSHFQGWTNHPIGSSAFIYTNGQLSILGSDNGHGGIAWADQHTLLVPGGVVEFDLMQYFSSDTDVGFDYPVFYLDGTFYGLNEDGTVGPVTTGGITERGDINNGNTVFTPKHFTVDVDALAGPGPHTIGFGVSSFDGLHGAGLLRIDNVTPALAPLILDCEGNGDIDSCEIDSFPGLDLDGNGQLDRCERPGDTDGDGVVGIDDLLTLLADWGACEGCLTDVDGDGDVDIDDLLTLLAKWG